MIIEQHPVIAVPMMSLAEYLVVWEAVSQYVENSEDVEPKTLEALDSALAVLERMDAMFIRMNGGDHG